VWTTRVFHKKKHELRQKDEEAGDTPKSGADAIRKSHEQKKADKKSKADRKATHPRESTEKESKKEDPPKESANP
jgi:hypothetical protein